MPISLYRHRNTSETVASLRGRLVWEFYDEVERICAQPIGVSSNCPVVALNVPASEWHTVRVLESETVIMEVKDGPYEPMGEEDILQM